MNYEFGIRNAYECTGVTCDATGDGRISELVAQFSGYRTRLPTSRTAYEKPFTANY